MLPIVLVAIAYVVGILWGLNLNLYLSLVLFVFIICMLILFKDKVKIKIIVLLLIYMFGVLYVVYKSENYKNQYVDGNINAEVTIISEVIEKDYYDVYNVKKDDGDKFILYIKKQAKKYEYGNKLKIYGAFENSKSKRNTGGFDYSRYLYSKNIYGIIKAANVDLIGLPKENLIMNIQLKIKEIYMKLLPKGEMGLLTGMIIGDTSDISKEVLSDFKESGITHLLAVSGSNVAYIILFTKFLLDKIIGKKYSNIISIFVIIIFMFVSGASASVVRASLMGIIIIISDIFSLKPNVYSSISLASILILLYNPYIICDVGFILSFGGTIGIILLNKIINDKISKYIKVKLISETLSVTLSAQIILFPIMIYYFNTLSLISIISNLFIVPLAEIITILGIILFLIGLINIEIARIISYSCYEIISIVLKFSDLFSKIPFNNINLPTINICQIFIYYLIVYCIFFKNKYKKILIYIIILIVSIQIIIFFIPNNYLNVNMIDVGQGDSIYIETPHKKTILIDGGGSENGDYDVGEKVVLPYLYDKGKYNVNLVIISHFHADHINGILTLLENIKIDKVIITANVIESDLYNKFTTLANEKNVEIIKVKKGDSFNIDEVNFQVLHPGNSLDANENNNSLVLKLNYKNVSMLFTGDMESIAEESIKGDITSNILKVAHHGSNTSSSENFVNRVKPQISIISVGENNFGHPSSKVIDLLKKYGCVYDTKTFGEIMLKIYNSGKIKLETCIK